MWILKNMEKISWIDKKTTDEIQPHVKVIQRQPFLFFHF